jgi:hypothetical protein
MTYAELKEEGKSNLEKLCSPVWKTAYNVTVLIFCFENTRFTLLIMIAVC